MQLPLPVIIDFVLVLARTLAWLYAAPVFSDRGFSNIGRTSTALALSVFLTPLVSHADASATAVPDFVVLAVGQIAVGLLLGWVASVVMSAFEVAGNHIDLFSGFAMSTLLDPMSGANSAVFARFTRLLFVTLLFATGAYRTLVTGFALSYRAVPVNSMPDIALDVPTVVKLVTGLFVSSLQIAAPLLGALFLTEVALAVAQRFAPTANVFVLGMPIKTLVTLIVLGTTLSFYPMYLERFLDTALRAGDLLIN
jgi:flagellar biosynthetic protein FliR